MFKAFLSAVVWRNNSWTSFVGTLFCAIFLLFCRYYHHFMTSNGNFFLWRRDYFLNNQEQNVEFECKGACTTRFRCYYSWELGNWNFILSICFVATSLMKRSRRYSVSWRTNLAAVVHEQLITCSWCTNTSKFYIFNAQIGRSEKQHLLYEGQRQNRQFLQSNFSTDLI